jgi:hypothetical protein
MTDFGVGARVRAARHMAGFGGVPELAAALKRRGLGATKLYEAEREEESLGFGDLAEIAHACGELPVEFFTADFSRLAEISDDPRKVIAERLAKAGERSDTRHADKNGDRPPPPQEGP